MEKSRKKLLYICPHLSTGGQPQYTYKQIKHFINDFDIEVVEINNSGGDAFVVQKNRIKSLAIVHTLAEDKSKVLDIIKEFNPDIIHFQEIPQFDLATNVLDQISKQKDITPDVLAQVLKVDVKEIVAVLKSLEERNIIKAISKTIGRGIDSNVVTERQLVKPLSKTIGEVTPTTTEMLVRYSYEWKSGFSDANLGTSRPFCKHLIEADKFYSRSEIEQMSARLGYSVWDRGGGWWTKKGTNTHSVSCRHEWKTNIVTRKK